MTKHLYRLGMVLAMSAGFALAQSTASPSTTPKTFPDQTQTPSAQQRPSSTTPSSTDQMPSSSQTPSSASTMPSAPSSTSPDQSTATPATSAPQTDQSTSPSSASPSSSSSQSSTTPSSSASSASGMSQSGMGAADTSKIQSALQQNPSLSGISVNSTDKGIELTGSANSSKDRKEAVRIAKENAAGKKVIDHIQVANAATGANPSPK